MTANLLRSRPNLKQAGSTFRNPHSHVKRGKRIVDHQEYFFRSESEYIVALFLSRAGYGWEHEPREFEFPLARGTRFFLPDFRAWPLERPDDYLWIEVKGWLDQKSQTRLRRFARYYPEEAKRLVIVTDSVRAVQDFLQKLPEEVRGKVQIWRLRQMRRWVS